MSCFFLRADTLTGWLEPSTCLLVVVNVAALSLHREDDTFGVFHALAIHAYCMTWSYAGLAAAGCGQLTAAVGEAPVRGPCQSG